MKTLFWTVLQTSKNKSPPDEVHSNVTGLKTKEHCLCSILLC